MTEFYDEREVRSEEQRKQELTTDILAQLIHAKSNAPAYTDLFKDIAVDNFTSLDDLVNLPITRKSALLELQAESPPFGGFAAFGKGELKYMFSSPGPIYEPQTHRADYWRFARFLYATGVRKGDLLINSFSYHMTPAGAMFDSACHALEATVFPGGVGQTEQQLDAIAALKPVGYSGTPSFLKILLEKAGELGKDISSISKAMVSGEAFPSPIRAQLAENGIHALQCYGSADLGLIAYESCADSGLIVDEDVYIEIVRPGTGDRVPDGEVGEVVVTTLNPDYPLIRFATGDMSAVLTGTSSCGRTNKRIKGWMGRADQTAKVKGMFIHPKQIQQIVDKHPEISRARLVVNWVNHKDSMTLHCESEQTDEGLAKQISQSVRDYCKVGGDVELVKSGSLPNDGVVIEDIRKYD
ncbi:MAG: phenylacetate--CoA ligase family protein [bacterium]